MRTLWIRVGVGRRLGLDESAGSRSLRDAVAKGASWLKCTLACLVVPIVARARSEFVVRGRGVELGLRLILKSCLSRRKQYTAVIRLETASFCANLEKREKEERCRGQSQKGESATAEQSSVVSGRRTQRSQQIATNKKSRGGGSVEAVGANDRASTGPPIYIRK